MLASPPWTRILIIVKVVELRASVLKDVFDQQYQQGVNRRWGLKYRFSPTEKSHESHV
jgi:hypothetical protein